MSVWNTGNGKFKDVNVGVKGIYDELLSYGIEDGAACDVTDTGDSNSAVYVWVYSDWCM